MPLHLAPHYHPRQPNIRRFDVRRVIVSEFVSLDGVLVLTYWPAGREAEG
jgi:hypothetical protein